jgi:hypothetical protein
VKKIKMTQLSTTTLIQSIITLLTEVYDGPPDPSLTWFVDNEPDSGVLGLIEHISAEQASHSVDGSGQRGSTIAANVEHLRWSLANANSAMRGEPFQPDWSESWNTISVDAVEWDHLRRSLRVEYETLREAISRQEELHGDYLNGVVALIPHAAFHLGLMRQMLERAQAAKS